MQEGFLFKKEADKGIPEYPDDYALVHRIIEDPTLFKKEIYEKYYSLVKKIIYNIVNTYTKDISVVSDLTQDVFLKIAKNLNSYQGTGSIKGWISQITRNEGIMFVRKLKKKSQVINSDFDLNNKNIDFLFSTKEHIVAESQIEFVQEVLTNKNLLLEIFSSKKKGVKAPKKMLRVFQLFFIEDLDEHAVRARLKEEGFGDTPENQIRSLKHKALSRIQNYFEKNKRFL